MNNTPHHTKTVFMEIFDVGLVIFAVCCGRIGTNPPSFPPLSFTLQDKSMGFLVGTCWNGNCGIGAFTCGGVCGGIPCCGETACGI